MNPIGGGGAVASGDIFAGHDQVVEALGNHGLEWNLAGIGAPMGLPDAGTFDVAGGFGGMAFHAGVEVDGILRNADGIREDGGTGAPRNFVGRGLVANSGGGVESGQPNPQGLVFFGREGIAIIVVAKVGPGNVDFVDGKALGITVGGATDDAAGFTDVGIFG